MKHLMAIRDMQMEVLRKGGMEHRFHLDRPDAVIGAIRRFL